MDARCTSQEDVKCYIIVQQHFDYQNITSRVYYAVFKGDYWQRLARTSYAAPLFPPFLQRPLTKHPVVYEGKTFYPGRTIEKDVVEYIITDLVRFSPLVLTGVEFYHGPQAPIPILVQKSSLVNRFRDLVT